MDLTNSPTLIHNHARTLTGIFHIRAQTRVSLFYLAKASSDATHCIRVFSANFSAPRQPFHQLAWHNYPVHPHPCQVCNVASSFCALLPQNFSNKLQIPDLPFLRKPEQFLSFQSSIYHRFLSTLLLKIDLNLSLHMLLQ